jgi:hypothetical protein
VPGIGSIDGRVTYDTELGAVAASGITVSLYPGDLTPGRPLQRQTTTDALGNYRFEDLEAGCFRMVFTEPPGFSAPDGIIFDLPNTREICLAQDEVAAGPDLTLVADSRMAALGGRVFSQSTGANEGLVLIDVYTADANGGRERFVGDTATGLDGRFTFTVAPDCYRLTFQAPTGKTFPQGTPDGQFYEPVVCVTAGQIDSNVDAVLN